MVDALTRKCDESTAMAAEAAAAAASAGGSEGGGGGEGEVGGGGGGRVVGDHGGEGKERIYHKLESVGFAVGHRFVERSTRTRSPRMSDPLDIIKYLCKDLWSALFRKKVDKLQTNHRGVYVLQDYAFRWIARFSSVDDEAAKREALKFLILPCGIIRGALANLGVTAVITADISTVPSCIFNIKIKN
jgi:hypothetical protein